MDNFLAILQATAVVGVLGVASTFPIITAGIDLSVGTLMTFCAVMAGVFLTYWGLPMWIGVLAAIGDGRALRRDLRHLDRQAEDPAVHRDARHDVGGQGAFARRVGHQADLLQRHAELLHDLAGLARRRHHAERARSQRRVDPVRCRGSRDSVILNRTALGRYTFALGSNEEAARLSGVNVDAWKIAVYSLTGAIVGVAGLIIASRLNSAQPALGQGYELEAIAAVVIGGTSLSGGHGHHSRHDHRRLHHERPDQRPAHHVGRAGMADGRDRRHHHPRRLRRHPASPARVRSRNVTFSKEG